jgi:hypothetical protein
VLLQDLLAAALTETEDVESVALRLESFGFCESVDSGGHASLEGGGWGDVCDLATVGAKKVVVVFGELLSQLIAGELVVGGDASHHTGDLEVDKVAVGRAARQIWETVSDVANADRVPGANQKLDDGPAAGGVALVGPAQTILHDIVDVVGSVECGHRRFTSDRKGTNVRANNWPTVQCSS